MYSISSNHSEGILSLLSYETASACGAFSRQTHLLHPFQIFFQTAALISARDPINEKMTEKFLTAEAEFENTKTFLNALDLPRKLTHIGKSFNNLHGKIGEACKEFKSRRKISWEALKGILIEICYLAARIISFLGKLFFRPLLNYIKHAKKQEKFSTLKRQWKTLAAVGTGLHMIAVASDICAGRKVFRKVTRLILNMSDFTLDVLHLTRSSLPPAASIIIAALKTLLNFYRAWRATA